jgi:hypothetical protein
MKTSELTGAALDWTVAKCEGLAISDRATKWRFENCPHLYSTEWALSGPIIQRQNISITGTDFEWWECNEGWYAHIGDCYAHGPTPLIAAMRCYVTSKLGDEVEVPQELQTT